MKIRKKRELWVSYDQNRTMNIIKINIWTITVMLNFYLMNMIEHYHPRYIGFFEPTHNTLSNFLKIFLCNDIHFFRFMLFFWAKFRNWQLDENSSTVMLTFAPLLFFKISKVNFITFERFFYFKTPKGKSANCGRKTNSIVFLSNVCIITSGLLCV